MKGPNQEANKAVVRRFVEEFQSQNRVDAIDEFVSRDFVNHSGTVRDVPGMERGYRFRGDEGDRPHVASGFPQATRHHSGHGRRGGQGMDTQDFRDRP